MVRGAIGSMRRQAGEQVTRCVKIIGAMEVMEVKTIAEVEFALYAVVTS